MKTIIITAVAFLGGLLFGWICCEVLSVNITDEEWKIMMAELEKERYWGGLIEHDETIIEAEGSDG